MTLIITGPAGTGKTYYACALGERACRNGIKVLYFTMNMLIENLKLVHLEGRETNFFRKLNAHDFQTFRPSLPFIYDYLTNKSYFRNYSAALTSKPINA